MTKAMLLVEYDCNATDRAAKSVSIAGQAGKLADEERYFPKGGYGTSSFGFPTLSEAKAAEARVGALSGVDCTIHEAPLTVGELVEILKGYDPGTRLAVTWEGTFQKVVSEGIYLSKCGVLVLDADDNNYKDRIVSGEKTVGDLS